MNAQVQDSMQKFGHRINAGLTVSSLEMIDGALEAGLTGQLKHDSTDPLNAFFVDQLRKHQAASLTLHCKAISFVDSQGLALMIILHRLCQAQGGKLVIKAAAPMLRSLLKLTRFDTMITVIDE